MTLTGSTARGLQKVLLFLDKENRGVEMKVFNPLSSGNYFQQQKRVWQLINLW
jgi:hypothetical protein